MFRGMADRNLIKKQRVRLRSVGLRALSNLILARAMNDHITIRKHQYNNAQIYVDCLPLSLRTPTLRQGMCVCVYVYGCWVFSR